MSKRSNSSRFCSVIRAKSSESVKSRLNFPQKIEEEDYPTAYEPWTKESDEFLTNYWNDESNKQSRSEKVKELCEKLDRSEGAINSRIKRLGLE